MLGEHVRLSLCLLCVVLELMHDSSDWLCEPYDGYIDDIIEVCMMTSKYA